MLPRPEFSAPFEKRYYRVPKGSIAQIRFILESYDGLAFVRTLDAGPALIEIAYPPSRREDVLPLLAEMEGEAGMMAADPPGEDDYLPL